MDIVTLQKQRIQAFLRARGAKAELARVAGLPETTLTTATRDDWDPRSETLSKLICALDIIQKVSGKPRPRFRGASAAA